MPKAVCVKCQRFFKPKKNGIVLLEQMPIANGAEPGTIDPTAWEPYKVWLGDLLECNGCGTEIIHGYGHAPASERYEPRFTEALRYVTHKVNDC